MGSVTATVHEKRTQSQTGVATLEHTGECDASEYPLQKKRHGLEFLRGIAHLRGRTNIIGAIMRVRSALAQATHQFFSQHGFLYVNTPLISSSDCEGAGEMFQVCSTLAPVPHMA
jgi:asparaginyl-tRNA synthetase